MPVREMESLVKNPHNILTELLEDIESHGHQLALLTDISTAELSARGKLGVLEFSTMTLNKFTDIESRLRNYRASIMPS